MHAPWGNEAQPNAGLSDRLSISQQYQYSSAQLNEIKDNSVQAQIMCYDTRIDPLYTTILKRREQELSSTDQNSKNLS